MTTLTAHVAVPVPLRTPFHYTVPVRLAGGLTVGQRVLVPFGRRSVTGYVVEYPSVAPPKIKLRDITRILDQAQPTFEPDMVRFLLWVAAYYHAPPGEVFRGAHPAGINQKSVPGLGLGTDSHQLPMELMTSTHARTLLEHLRSVGRPVALRDLPISLPDNLMRTLISARVLERVPVVVDGRVKAKTIKAYRAVRVAPSAGRGPGGRMLKRDEIHAWLAERGAVSLTDIKAQFPHASPHLRTLVTEGALVIEQQEMRRNPLSDLNFVDDPPILNDAQQRAVDQINASTGYGGFLLHGITGSGKTEVYLRVIQQRLNAGLGAIVLVPEIALTPQLVARFRARLGDRVAVLHSGLSEGERYDEWRRIRTGAVPVVIGARSAVFAPIQQLGIIIVDEEHDPSFKQNDGVRYHGRDMALVRGHRANVPVVLGSATPSLESLHNAEQGKLTTLSLPNRATGGTLPRVELIDLKTEPTPADGQRYLSKPVRAAIAASLARGEQSIVFINRRGFSSFVLCTNCGEVIDCHRCAISMTWHKRQRRLHCHYCDAARPLPERCPACHQPSLELPGRGTERIEEHLATLFPTARIGRLDRDTAGGGGLQSVLDGMRHRTIDILVGTQMVTKGHDFPFVTTVAILEADSGLNFPDFRAAERTFQLLAQVAGRAGRASRKGRVIVQSWAPDHYVLQALIDHDHVRFAQEELAFRRASAYPPYRYAVSVRIDGTDPSEVERSAHRLAKDFMTAEVIPGSLNVRGPAPMSIERLRGRTRWSFLALAMKRGDLRRGVEQLKLDEQANVRQHQRTVVDIDPYDLL
ncbi:MAG: primosomal protein N' [Myxococcota bacterium]|nr:primosomal protein N' [Myxococcota bacterium]